MYPVEYEYICEIQRNLRETKNIFPQIPQINAENSELKYRNDD